MCSFIAIYFTTWILHVYSCRRELYVPHAHVNRRNATATVGHRWSMNDMHHIRNVVNSALERDMEGNPKSSKWNGIYGRKLGV